MAAIERGFRRTIPPREFNQMRAFTAVAGILFALLFVVHIARLFAEGAGPLRNPIFILVSLVSLGLAIWSFFLLFRQGKKAG
jgi:hypothetical protein